jgi:hypothetical protein
MKRFRSGLSLFVVISVVGLAILSGASHRADATPSTAPAGPSVWFDTMQTSNQGALYVDGQHFTPGGQVYIAIYDVWGSRLYSTMWTTASTTIPGTPGGSDADQGTIDGGLVSVEFDNLCDANVLVRAYDKETQVWSSWLTADPAC